MLLYEPVNPDAPIGREFRVRPATRSRLRTINRVRWRHKWRIAQSGQLAPALRMRYVLWDPEIDTFSYELADPVAIVQAIAPVLGKPVSELMIYARELQEDQELHDRIRRATRFHPETKRKPPVGRHFVGYLCLRARRPTMAVEAGIRHGLGSLVMLRALERNAAEGADGFLLSVDIDPSAGALVGRRSTRWEFAVGEAGNVLPLLLRQGEVGYLNSDSLPHPDQTRAEVAAACANAQWPLIVQQSGWNNVSRDICGNNEFSFVDVHERSFGHFHAGRRVHVCRLPRMPSEYA